jgi:phosphonate transport system ATP-binding protein
LVALLHDVALALERFPRIVGLRSGQVLFDLPAAEVTALRLEELYGGTG